MKISTNKVVISLTALGAVYSGYICYKCAGDSKKFKSVDDLKMEIKQKDPKRYDSLMHDDEQRCCFIDWQYEVNRMNDSLRTDSMIKRAYFEGAQMVRDSINKTERK